MNKKKKLLCILLPISLLLVGAAIATPILVLNSKNQKINKLDNYKSWLKIQNNNVLYIKNFDKFSDSNLENIKCYNDKNQLININKEDSKIIDNTGYLVLNSESSSSSYELVNSSNNKRFKFNQTCIKTFNQYNLIDDQKWFYDFLEDASNNNIPTIGFIRNASLVVQQAFYIALTNYFLNSNNQSNLDSTYWFASNDIWNQNRINFNSLIENNIWNGESEFNPDFSPQSFNLFNSNMHIDNMIDDSDKVIDVLTSILNKLNVEKFDLVIDDIWFVKFIEKANQKFKNFIFRHVNRILVMSDGANHTNSTVPFLVDRLTNMNMMSKDDTITMLNNFLNNEKANISNNDIFNLLLLKKYEIIKSNSNYDFIHFINYDANIFNSIDINDNLRWNESAFSTNFVDYSKLIKNEEQKNRFLNVYSNLFFDYDLSYNKVFINGSDQYDPNKKNAIFIGSSLFKPLDGQVTANNYSRLTSMPNVLKEVQSTLQTFLDKYPPSEYNIIFKLHPVFSNADDPQNLGAINYVKLITNNQITNPIIVSSSIPLESWISIDYYNYSTNNLTSPSIIFRSDSPQTWTTFFGLQATTTTIQTTRLFYQSTFNLDKEIVANQIPLSNFPVPKYFPVVKRLSVDNFILEDFTDDNLKQILKIYEPFCPSVRFNAPGLSLYDSIVLNFENN